MKIVFIFLVAFVFILVVLLLVLLKWSPGKIEPYLNENGQVLTDSIAEIHQMDIGGVSQGMIITGKSEDNPVLLFLHGGPGNPEYVMSREAGLELEDVFTVCWWEQRGTGMSYNGNMVEEDMTLEQFIQDTVEVTNYLRERFGQDKIYLMGHSWGSFLGISTVSRYPELYTAYIGVGQISNQMESERLAYHLMQDEVDDKTKRKLDVFSLDNADSITPEYLMLRSDTLSALGYGVFHEPQSKLDLLMPIFKAREYTLSDIYGYAMGSLFSLRCPINNTCYTTDLRQDISNIDVPVFLFHGVYDRQVSYELAKDYYDILNAPEKAFYSFEHSAHSPFFEEPELFMQILIEDILSSLKSKET